MEISRVAKANKLHPQTLEKQYKEILSHFREWENEVVSKALSRVPLEKRMAVKEITADLAESMDWICWTNFMNAKITADRFHVQQVVSEAVQEIHINLRRKAIDEENQKMMEAKKDRASFRPKRFSNGDTKKQLLARGRYFLFQPSNKSSPGQRERADILFREYSDIKKTYDFSMYFRSIFEHAQTRKDAEKRFMTWMNEVSLSNIPTLISAAHTIQRKKRMILVNFSESPKILPRLIFPFSPLPSIF